jgi:hypothetical protein
MHILCRFAISALAVVLVAATVVVFLTVANLTADTKPPAPAWPSPRPVCHTQRQPKDSLRTPKKSTPYTDSGAEECQPPGRRQRTRSAKPLQPKSQHRQGPSRDAY